MAADGTPGLRRISRKGAGGALSTGSSPAARLPGARAIVRGSGRMSSAMTTPTIAIAAAANHGTTRVSSSRSLPANRVGRQGARARRRRALRTRRRRSLAPAARVDTCPLRQCAPVERFRSSRRLREAEDDERGVVGRAAELSTADGADREPARDDGDPSKRSIRRPAGRAARRARGEEDRGPEPQDRLDSCNEDERDRRDGAELNTPDSTSEAERGEGVTPNRMSWPRSSNSSIPVRNARAPPCAGWRTYGPRSAACATRPTQTTRRPRASFGRTGARPRSLTASASGSSVPFRGAWGRRSRGDTVPSPSSESTLGRQTLSLLRARVR